MDFLKDFKIIHFTSLKRSLKAFKKSWLIIFTGFIYTLLNQIIYNIIGFLFRGALGILAGLASAIISSALISSYLYILFNIIKYDKFTLDDFKDGFKVYLRKIYGIFFIMWIVSYLLNMIGTMTASYSSAFNLSIAILVLIILNPLPEIVYQKYYSSFESMAYSVEFMKRNWINWLLPNMIFGFILYKVSGVILTEIFSFYIKYNFMKLGRYLITQATFSFMMIYRGHLFDILSNSTRRKRLYMRRLND